MTLEDGAGPAWSAASHAASVSGADTTDPRFPCATPPPFHGTSEPLWRSTVAYREFAFVEYNTRPAVPGRGSAIFLHDDRGHPTNGCISLPRPELLQLLRRLQPGSTISISVGA